MLKMFDSIKQLAKQAGEVPHVWLIIRTHPAITDKPLGKETLA
jgi:hypothetical protein